jgi:hypothetical protein
MGDPAYRLTLLRLLLWGSLVRWADSQDAPAAAACTLCFGGQEAANLTNGILATGVSCQATNSILGNTPSDSPDCIRIQMEAYQGCGCPTYDQDTFCSMCSDSSFDIPSPLTVIPVIDMTCQRALFVTKESGLCDATARAAYICGCPGAPAPECFFCSDGGATKPSLPNRILPPHYNLTCGDITTIAPFYTADECPSLTADIGINMDQYCGCTNSDEGTTTSCSLCGETPMALPDAKFTFDAGEMTCTDLGDLAEAIDDTAFCTDFKGEYSDYCCLGITGQPSMAPVAAASGGGSGAPTPAASPTAEDPAPAPTTTTSNASFKFSSRRAAAVSLCSILGTLLWSTWALIY